MENFRQRISLNAILNSFIVDKCGIKETGDSAVVLFLTEEHWFVNQVPMYNNFIVGTLFWSNAVKICAMDKKI